MPAPKLTDAQIIEAFRRFGSPEEISRHYGISVRQIYRRRNEIEARLGIILASHQNDLSGRQKIELPRIGIRQLANVTGPVIIFGDCHWWPNQPKTVAHRALLEVIRDLKPSMIVCNGDALDLPSSSRHPPLGFGEQPTHDVAQEIALAQEYLAEIEMLAPPDCAFVWNIGNHDLRLSAKLASVAPEVANLKGVRLEDHFPAWAMGMSLMINDRAMIKHRPARGGVHSTHGTIVASGLDLTVSNHLHQLRISPLTTYRRRRAYGVDAGTLADFGPDKGQFSYAEDSVLGWASGFCVLHFDSSGNVLPPELCEVVEGRAIFRGQVVV